MSIAFWVKLISGVENHAQSVGLMTTWYTWNTEGWQIILYNWGGTNVMKFQVKDYQAQGIRFQKTMDDVTSLFGQWSHYVAIYQYVGPSNPSAQYQIYKNGQLNNDGDAVSPPSDFSENTVDRLVFGWQTMTQNSPPQSNAVFDEVLIFDGALTADLVDKLYKNYEL